MEISTFFFVFIEKKKKLMCDLFISAFISFLLPLKSGSRSLMYNNALFSPSALSLFIYAFIFVVFA